MATFEWKDGCPAPICMIKDKGVEHGTCTSQPLAGTTAAEDLQPMLCTRDASGESVDNWADKSFYTTPTPSQSLAEDQQASGLLCCLGWTWPSPPDVDGKPFPYYDKNRPLREVMAAQEAYFEAGTAAQTAKFDIARKESKANAEAEKAKKSF